MIADQRATPGSARGRRPAAPACRLIAAACLAAVGTLAACSRPVPETTPASSSPSGSASLTIGVVVPLSGPYVAFGPDPLYGWKLYLSQHHQRLGGHPVKVVVVNEGDGGPTARASVDTLIAKDHVSAVVGAVNPDAVRTIAAPVTVARIPFIAVGARPADLGDVSYIWDTNHLAGDGGRVAGPVVHAAVAGPVYVIGADNGWGHGDVDRFVQAFTAAGGRLANPGGQPTFTPWPDTVDFAAFLGAVKASGARAVYASYAGPPAVPFVLQAAQSLPGTPVYGPASLTEGAALAVEGPAADGIYTVATYPPTPDNPANTAYTDALQAADSIAPSIYNLTACDAASVLDKAIATAGTDPTPPGDQPRPRPARDADRSAR